MKFKLSNQAIGAIMMSLQKGLMEECDITSLLRDFKMVDTPDGLMVENPPLVVLDDEPQELNQDQ